MEEERFLFLHRVLDDLVHPIDGKTLYCSFRSRDLKVRLLSEELVIEDGLNSRRKVEIKPKQNKSSDI